jgi:hypothetical protein
MIAKILAASAFLLVSAGLALADPVGSYNVHGTNPKGHGTYSGAVTVQKTGDTYKVKWVIGDSTYTGTGIGSDKFIAVTYTSDDDQTGLALYAQSAGGGWEGVWTYTGSRNIGTENWTAK